MFWRRVHNRMTVQDEEKRSQIIEIRKNQDELYSDMDRFTVQVILTRMGDSPMMVDEVFALQQRITNNITEHRVIALLDELVDRGYAKRLKNREYEYTQKSSDTLEREGITKEFLFPMTS
jgi:hypothetical protein